MLEVATLLAGVFFFNVKPKDFFFSFCKCIYNIL